MKKKFKRELHNFILRCVTDVALFTLIASVFAVDLWPYKSAAAFFVSGMWLLMFMDANMDRYLEEE